MSFKYAKQLYLIAKELKAIENESYETKVASVKVAGWFSKLFADGMNEDSKETCQEVLERLNGSVVMRCLMRGDINTLNSQLQPLKKIKQLNATYDKFIKWFKDVYDTIPKSVKAKAKNLSDDQLIKEIKDDDTGTLKDIEKQFERAMQVLKKDFDIAKKESGTATESWKDAFGGWKINFEQ